MASKIEICNMAISHISIGTQISNIDSDQSEEAKICQVFYDSSRQEMLTDATWHFSRSILPLALHEENPNKKWMYSYIAPVDCLRTIKILSEYRTDNDETRVLFEEGVSEGVRVIYTDRQDAELEYIVDLEETELFPPSFTTALTFLLAFYISPKLKGEADKSLLERYEWQLNKARGKDFNSQTDTDRVLPRTILRRDGLTKNRLNRYIG